MPERSSASQFRNRSTGISPDLRGGLMVCGTGSDSGKTTIVAGLCRLLARSGVRVAPFKAQNMALNSAVTTGGHEIGRAQYLQAQAAGIPPEVAMNPILLKPTGERSSQVVVMGKPVGVLSAAEYHDAKPDLFAMVTDTLADLRSRFDVVLLEGAGSPAEINLLDHDIVNLTLAHHATLRSVIVGDIDPGGVFAALFGTVGLLPPDLRATVGGFIINKLRGDPALLFDGTDQLEARCGVPTIGVVPMLADLHLDAEDSFGLARSIEAAPDAALDVAVVRFPQLSNFTDVDPLALEPDVAVRYVRSARELGRPDLVILPGSKSTVADLQWLRGRGLDQAIDRLVQDPSVTVLGLCGGYQMLGTVIDDQHESRRGTVTGLGHLPVRTTFGPDKILGQRHGRALGHPVVGYEIRQGRVDETAETPGATAAESASTVWLTLDHNETTEVGGVHVANVFGTALHGLFSADEFRRSFLAEVAERAGTTFVAGSIAFDAQRDHELDRLADHLAAHLDLAALADLISGDPTAV